MIGLENLAWYQVYLIIDIAFVITAILRLHIPAHMIANAALNEVGIDASDYISKLGYTVEIITFFFLSLVMFPILALSLIINYQGSVRGYANSIVTGIQERIEEQKDNE